MKKQHHTVSEFYLRGFAGPPATRGDPRGFWVYRRGEGVPKWLPPESVAIRKHFYSYRDESGRRCTDIEDVLGQVESVAAPIIRKAVTRGVKLTEQEHLRLAFFVALTWARTTKHRAVTVEIAEHLGNAQLRAFFSDKERLKATLAKYEQASGKTLDPDDTYEAIMTGGVRRVLGEQARVGLSLTTAKEVCVAAMGMRWALLEAPPGSQFVTSDTPVVLAASNRMWPEIGWTTPDLEVTFPMDATHCLLLTHDGESGRGQCVKEFVEEVTRRATVAADLEVYARRKSPTVARQLH